MKRADIKKGTYAVRIGKKVCNLRLDPGKHAPRGTVAADVADGAVALNTVLAPWDDYCFEQAWDEAHAMDRRRDLMRERAAERAAWIARLDSWVSAFAGIATERPREDLGEKVRDILGRMESQTVTLTRAEVEAVALRILTLSEVVRQNALTSADAAQTGWGVPASYPPDPEPQVEVRAPRDVLELPICGRGAIGCVVKGDHDECLVDLPHMEPRKPSTPRPSPLD